MADDIEKEDHFRTLEPRIDGNLQLRIPQREGYDAIRGHFEERTDEREVGIVLPVGCGKSGLITLAPFAVGSKRTLVVAPGVRIAAQLVSDFDPTDADMFYRKCQVLDGTAFPEPAEIRGDASNRGDLAAADVVITNIQQLQGTGNRWLITLPNDFFDLILVDEGHHNVAESWNLLRQRFPTARIVSFSATPVRADGQLMAGRIIYSFPIFRAIQEGYVKRLKAVVLNPRTLRYVREENGQEIEVPLEEVVRLGEEDADFRRSIVSSRETLATIVDASIRELEKMRTATADRRHKIIASALNFRHCAQIVEAYRARGLHADYIHSREDARANEGVLRKLENHELDAVVQVRMLGEGFDHPYLSVAAVCSVFRSLAPFAQFVGRIMRVIDRANAASPHNRGTVVFHAGANIARRWADFQVFSEADQEFFDRLLPLEALDFQDAQELELVLRPADQAGIEVRAQGQVLLQEIPLIAEDQEARRALDLLMERGFTADDYRQAEELRRVPVTRQRARQAARGALDERIRNEAGRILRERHVNPEGRELDRRRLNRSNFVVLKSAIDRHCNEAAGRTSGERSELTQREIDVIQARFTELVEVATREAFDGEG